jgi:hypothetical protein
MLGAPFRVKRLNIDSGGIRLARRHLDHVERAAFLLIGGGRRELSTDFNLQAAAWPVRRSNSSYKVDAEDRNAGSA